MSFSRQAKKIYDTSCLSTQAAVAIISLASAENKPETTQGWYPRQLRVWNSQGWTNKKNHGLVADTADIDGFSMRPHLYYYCCTSSL